MTSATPSADGKWHEYHLTQVVNSTYERSGSTITSSPRVEFYTGDMNKNGTAYQIDIDIKDIQVMETSLSFPFKDGAFESDIITDTSGFGNHGTGTSIMGGSMDSPRYDLSTTFAASGNRPKIGCVFDQNQYIYALTVSVWFKTDTMNGTSPNLFSLECNDFIRARIASSNSMWFYMNVAGKINYATHSVGKTITDNQWHFYAIRFRSGKVDVFIDDKKIGSSDFTSSGTYLVDSGRNGWWLGGYNQTSECFSGSLSDFRIYSTALLDTEILGLYNAPVSITSTGTLITQGELKEE